MKRPLILFNCSGSGIKLENDQYEVLQIEDYDTKSQVDIGKACVYMLISDFVLFGDENDEFHSLILAYCDSNKKPFGCIKNDCIKNDKKKEDKKKDEKYSNTFYSMSDVQKWVNKHIKLKKYKVKPKTFGTLQYSSIKAYMIHHLKNDNVILSLYYSCPHVRKLLDSLPRNFH